MALKAGRVGVNPEDVDFMTGHIRHNYSSDEVAIGVDADGNTIYERMIKTFTPSTSGALIVVDDSIKTTDVHVLTIIGTFHTENGNDIPINFNGTTSSAYTFVRIDGINMQVTDFYRSLPVTFFVTYTKNVEISALSLEEE